jgi:hypothetical protein
VKRGQHGNRADLRILSFWKTRRLPIDVLMSPFVNFAKMEGAGAILLSVFQPLLPRVADPTQLARR